MKKNGQPGRIWRPIQWLCMTSSMFLLIQLCHTLESMNTKKSCAASLAIAIPVILDLLVVAHTCPSAWEAEAG